jgi:uncharacterized protein YndB with AHSA1/START domain
MSAVAPATAEVAPNDEASIEIAAPPLRLWRLVSDVTQMPRWSPETFRAQWLDGLGATATPGARFRGWNRSGWVTWSTLCEVDVCDPGVEFTFSTRFGRHVGTRWTYRFAANGAGGTRVTETRTALYKPRYARLAYATILRGHEDSFAAGMARTLERLKLAAEAAG